MFGSAAKWINSHWLAPAIVFSLALVLFLINLDRPPHADELHHVLAAQHLIETGRPILAEGEYWRGILHTWLVAISYEVFGEGLASARIPSVLLVALVAPILFLWVRREAGSLAAWLTAALFISSPFTVEIAQFSRMYALQMFFFMLGTMCFYYTLVGELSLTRRGLLGALTTVLLVLALQQQHTSLVAMVGIAVWTFGLVAQRVFFNPVVGQNTRKVMAAGLIIIGILIILALTLTGDLQWALHQYQSTPLFNIDRRNEYWFYYLRFFLFYPTLWTLVGLFAVLAVVRSPRLAWLAISIFGVGFVLMSFAGTKNTRYLAFASPFLTIVWGIGLACVWPQLWRYAEATRMRLIETFGPPQRLGSIAGNTVFVVALSTIVLSNPFWLRTAAVIGNVAPRGRCF
jgi:4-amino-4-deoxy-L-arabinose transferase-like glycosyltransferase